MMTSARIVIDNTKPGTMQMLGGAANDEWNSHFLGKLVAALPGGLSSQRRDEIIKAVATGQLAIKPSDPIEAMLAGQIIAANEAALDMYRRAWIEDQAFEVRTRYLVLADKAARTIAALAEALDRHRSRGQQQITVRHVTVNADKAVVADQILTGVSGSGRG